MHVIFLNLENSKLQVIVQIYAINLNEIQSKWLKSTREK